MHKVTIHILTGERLFARRNSRFHYFWVANHNNTIWWPTFCMQSSCWHEGSFIAIQRRRAPKACKIPSHSSQRERMTEIITQVCLQSWQALRTSDQACHDLQIRLHFVLDNPSSVGQAIITKHPVQRCLPYKRNIKYEIWSRTTQDS